MLTIVVIVLTVGCAIASPIDSKIVGGKPAKPDQFPYQVSLRLVNENNRHFCGGSIVSPQWILTAAHCVREITQSEIVVVVGTNYLDSGGKKYSISEIIIHDDYNPQNLVNDIAVLKIKGNIQLGDAIETIDLATASLPSDLNLTLSGWGLTSCLANQPPNHLQYVTLKSLTVVECQAIMPEYTICDTHQCAISPFGQGACKGDSGGPLVYDSKQVGIFSGFAYSCASEAPDVFTSVAAYRNWIKGATDGV